MNIQAVLLHILLHIFLVNIFHFYPDLVINYSYLATFKINGVAQRHLLSQ